jgi:hypothetical protein
VREGCLLDGRDVVPPKHFFCFQIFCRWLVGSVVFGLRVRTV